MTRALMLAAWLLGLGVIPSAQAQTPAQSQPQRIGPEIRWRVENPFRFFTDATDTDIHRLAFDALSDEDRRRPVAPIERALSGRFPKGWGESVFRKVCWDARRNQYGCKADPNYLSPVSHRVVVELAGFDPDAGIPRRCEWRQTPLHGKRSAVPRVITASCAEAVALDVPYPGGLRVSVRTEGPPVAETDISVQDVFVVGMGDSFGSGEGNPDDPVAFSRERTVDYGKGPRGAQLVGYPARIGAWDKIGDATFIEHNAKWLDQACHRSVYSYQLRTALQLAIENPHRAVTFAGFACSGAEIIDGVFQIYKGNEWVPNPPAKSQISFVAEAQCGGQSGQETFPATYDLGGDLPVLKDLTVNRCSPLKARKIDLMLLSVGGNDIGFARLVANAVLSDQSTLKTLGGWMGQVHGPKEAKPALEQLALRYKALNRALHNILHMSWDEYDRVILTAYPPLAILEDGRSVCPDDRGGMTVYPDFKLEPKRAREGEQVAEELHQTMQKISDTYHWTFAQRHRPEFNGHGICAGASDENLSPADDLRLPLKLDGGDWHPYNPADFRPYAPRSRWFRTPNDAYLTGNFHMSATLANQAQKFKSLVWFQLLLASTYSGAFHPSAEGHAVIADSALEKARQVLGKYSGR